MKILPILLLLLVGHLSFAQTKNKADSLSKYSYSLYFWGQKDSFYTACIGTCFFVKKNNKIFLVTAKHNLTNRDDSCNDLRIKNDDTVFLVLKNCKELPINVSIVRDTSTCTHPQIYPDVITYIVNDTESCNVNYFDLDFSYSSPKYSDGILVFGYSKDLASERNIELNMFNPQKIEFNVPNYKIHPFGIYEKNGKEIYNYNNYVIAVNNFTELEYLKGFSGSPVLIKNLLTLRWELLGVLVLTSKSSNSISVVKPEFIKFN